MNTGAWTCNELIFKISAGFKASYLRRNSKSCLRVALITQCSGSWTDSTWRDRPIWFDFQVEVDLQRDCCTHGLN